MNNKYGVYLLVSKKIISDLENKIKLSSKDLKKPFWYPLQISKNEDTMFYTDRWSIFYNK